MIKDEQINEILRRADIVEVVSEYGINLERAGKNFRALCPFHDDSNPSFYVSPEKQIATCMSCHEGGNAIGFVKKMDNISFTEAALKLAQRYGIKLDESVKYTSTNNYANEYEATKQASLFYMNYLYASKSGEEALDYLYKRGLTDETIKRFRIGLAPDKQNQLYKSLTADDVISTKTLIDVGLISKHEENYFDFFNARIMFPIINEFGNVLGFSGRVYMNGQDSTSKYINTKDTSIYHKSDVLYNLNNAKEYIRRKKRVVLFEGQMDVIQASLAGVEEGVCSMGTAFTIGHAKLLKKYIDNLIICYDGDKAGQKATNNVIDILENIDVNVHIIMLPEKLDPDEYIKKYGDKAFRDYIDNNQMDAYSFKYNYLKASNDLSSFAGIESFKKAVFELLKDKSQVIKELYIKNLSDDLKISFDALSIDYNSYFKLKPIQKNVEIRKEPKKSLKISDQYKKAEQILISYAMDDKILAIKLANKIKDIKEVTFEGGYIIELLEDYYKTHEGFNYEEVYSKLNDEKKIYLSECEKIYISSDYETRKKEFEECLLKIAEYRKILKIDELNKKAIKETDLLRKNEYLKERDEIRKTIKCKGGK